MFSLAAAIPTGFIFNADIFCPIIACIMLFSMVQYSTKSKKQTTSTDEANMSNTEINTETVTAEVYASLPMVPRFFLGKTRNMAAAEDAAMNGIVKAIENIDKYNGKSKVSTWVITVAYRLWLDGIKSHSNSKTVYTGDAVFLENMGGTYDTAHSFDNEPSIWDTAQSVLSEKQFVVVVAHYRDGLKYREVAETLDIPIGSVMSRLNGAKKKLAQSADFKGLFGDAS